jgi:AhpD family alkylhydroperoxidase
LAIRAGDGVPGQAEISGEGAGGGQARPGLEPTSANGVTQRPLEGDAAARTGEVEVEVCASQLNGCAYCIDMHTKDARAGGETEQRLYALPAWRETPFFAPRERAALAFTERVTLMAGDHVPQEAYEAVAEHFSEDEIAALVGLIVVINAWNTVGVATRAWEPGSYSR